MFDVVKQEPVAVNVAEWVSIGCKGGNPVQVSGLSGATLSPPTKKKSRPLKKGSAIFCLFLTQSVSMGLVAAESWLFYSWFSPRYCG